MRQLKVCHRWHFLLTLWCRNLLIRHSSLIVRAQLVTDRRRQIDSLCSVYLLSRIFSVCCCVRPTINTSSTEVPCLVFTRTWLRYVQVLAIANPSVSVCRLSFVTFVHSAQPGGIFCNVFMPYCTLFILWPLCKILRKSSKMVSRI